MTTQVMLSNLLDEIRDTAFDGNYCPTCGFPMEYVDEEACGPFTDESRREKGWSCGSCGEFEPDINEEEEDDESWF